MPKPAGPTESDRMKASDRGQRPSAASRCIGLTCRPAGCGVIAGAPRCRRAPAPAARSHRRRAACRTANSARAARAEAPCCAQQPDDRMAQVVGQRRAVLLDVARQHQQVRRLGDQRFQRHLAAARQPVGGGHVAEAGGGQRRVGQAAGARDRAADLIDDGSGRRCRRAAPARPAAGRNRRSAPRPWPPRRRRRPPHARTRARPRGPAAAARPRRCGRAGAAGRRWPTRRTGPPAPGRDHSAARPRPRHA